MSQDVLTRVVDFLLKLLNQELEARETPRMKPIPSTSDEPTSENGQTETVSALFLSSPPVKVSKLELKKV